MSMFIAIQNYLSEKSNDMKLSTSEVYHAAK